MGEGRNCRISWIPKNIRLITFQQRNEAFFPYLEEARQLQSASRIDNDRGFSLANPWLTT